MHFSFTHRFIVSFIHSFFHFIIKQATTCFAGSETIQLESGETKPISAISVGDRVLAADAAGKTSYAAVVAVPHAKNDIKAVFSHIASVSGKVYTFSPFFFFN